MIHNILLALWFFIPAGFANVAPVLVAKLPGLREWNSPIDGGRLLHGQPLLGPHKTWRGLLAGLILATAVLYVQQLLYGHYDAIKYVADGVDYSHLPVLILGPLFALGALGGDALESFFKRRRGLKSGQAWVGFDQLDYILGAILFTLPVVQLQPVQYLWVIVVWFAIHLAASYIGWVIGLKDEPI